MHTEGPDNPHHLPVVNLNEPAFWQDMHTPLAEVMEASPLFLSTEGLMHVARHADVESVLKDPRFVAADLLAMNGLSEGPVWAWWQKVMFSKDPPEHTRLRSLVSRVFTPRAVNELRPAIRSQAENILLPAFKDARLDAQGDLGHRLPLAVISDMLAVPEDDRAKFGDWTSTLGIAFGAISDVGIRRQVEMALEQIEEYVGGMIAERRLHPGGDLLSALIAVEENGDRLSTDEMVALIENLMFAGHDTTRGALAAMVVLLANNPEQWRAIAKSPELIPRAVEEVLRFEPITFLTSRLASQDVEIGGTPIQAGEPLALCIASACRDPREYPAPGIFDVNRENVRSPTFGAGIHYCVGAALARAEMEESLALLVANAEELHLAEPARWEPLHHIRCYQPPVWVEIGG
jgi:cytochrome P450